MAQKTSQLRSGFKKNWNELSGWCMVNYLKENLPCQDNLYTHTPQIVTQS